MGGRGLLSGGDCRESPGGEEGAGAGGLAWPGPLRGWATTSVEGSASQVGAPAGWEAAVPGQEGLHPGPVWAGPPCARGRPAARSPPAFLLPTPVPLGSEPGPVPLSPPGGMSGEPMARPLLWTSAARPRPARAPSWAPCFWPCSLSLCTASLPPLAPLALVSHGISAEQPPPPGGTAESSARSLTRVGCHVNFPLTHSPI